MKKLPALLLILILTLVAGSSCHRQRNLSPFGWTPVDPEFDSLTLRVERLMIACESIPEIFPIVERMESIAALHPDDEVIARRTMFWRGRAQFYLSEDSLYSAYIDSAIAMTDSAHSPYDYRRMKWQVDLDYHEPTVERYQALVDQYEFFLSTGDLVISGATAQEIGLFLYELGVYDEAKQYLRKSDSLVTLGGYADIAANNRMNLANVYLLSGDTAACEREWHDMLQDTVYRMPDAVRHRLLINVYSLRHRDTVALDEAFRLAQEDPGAGQLYTLYSAFLTEVALRNNNLKKAREYLDFGRKYIDQAENPSMVRDYLRSASNYWVDEGNVDSTLEYLREWAELNDSINRANNGTDVCNAMLAGRIRMLHTQAELKNRESVIFTISVCFAALLLLIGACIVFWRKLQQQRLAKVSNDLELERTNRRLLANELVIKEKDRLINDMESEMTRLSELGEVSRSTAIKFGSTIRQHSSVKQHRESFVEVFGEVHPGFSERLKADYPTLTAADIRMSSYIVTGMENKHIAGVLGIRPESVKQARWRLRSKFGLTSADSLEEFLRRYNSTYNA